MKLAVNTPYVLPTTSLCKPHLTLFGQQYLLHPPLSCLLIPAACRSKRIAILRPFFCPISCLNTDFVFLLQTEDEGNHGNDDTRCFILSTLASQGRSRVHCVLCEEQLLVFDRYPLVDGTFFLSPRQHAKSCIEVKIHLFQQSGDDFCLFFVFLGEGGGSHPIFDGGLHGLFGGCFWSGNPLPLL